MTPCLNTLAMGDTHAVNFGQMAHLAVVLRQRVLRGELDPAVYVELPGENYEHHPMLEELEAKLRSGTGVESAGTCASSTVRLLQPV